MTFSYDGTLPNPPHDPADDVDQMQTNSASISSLIAVDHIGFNVAGGGQHKQVTFSSNNVPTPPVSPPILFTNTVAGLPQPFFYSGDATHSSTQYVNSANGSTFLLGGMIVKWGNFGFANASGTQAVTFTSPFPNNLYSVSLLPNTVTPAAGVGSVSFGGTGSPAGFTAYRSNTSGGVTYFYIAIGN